MLDIWIFDLCLCDLWPESKVLPSDQARHGKTIWLIIYSSHRFWTNQQYLCDDWGGVWGAKL